jgi:hypothetical protein
MSSFTTITTIGMLMCLGHFATIAIASDQASGDEKKDAGEKVAVKIWVLSFERRDANPLADKIYLPRMIDPARAKLKATGARKISFNFEEKQLGIWFEGNQEVTLKAIQTAFPGLELKVVAKVTFSQV